MENLLDNYYQMVSRVDALCREIQGVLSSQISCSEGCSSCCTAITLFPVEAAALNAAFEALPDEQRNTIIEYVTSHAEGERCPLLDDHRCLLYAARPIICRTHGLPIIYTEGNERKVDCCPLNLNEDEQPVSGSAVIDLDRLNALLVAVNALFLSHADATCLSERLTIAESLKVKS
jgi:Fe-S-cluster containining protein